MPTVILQNAHLEILKRNAGKTLLSSEERGRRRPQKPGKKGACSAPPEEQRVPRPDILHQCLLMLLDSPLCKAGHLRILVSSKDNRVIEVNPCTRIPRVYTRFAGLMVQLLERQRIYAAESKEVLLQCHKGPVSAHIPGRALKLGMSQQGSNFHEYIRALGKREEEGLEVSGNTGTKENADCTPQSSSDSALTAAVERMVIYVNVTQAGNDDFPEATLLSLSDYGLSAATCCSKITSVLEQVLGVF